MTRLIALLATAVVALLLAAGPASAASDRNFEVVTYNIHHAVGLDGQLDLERIAREIDATGAEVALLQEVDRHFGARSQYIDEPAWLAQRLGMHVVYGANLDREPEAPGNPRRQYGTAILSRFPIVSWRNTLLPRPENGEQRGLLEAVVQRRRTRVRIANTHLQHNSAVERLAQSERIAELLAASPEPVVVGGDLNAVPGAPELAPLFARFHDAWARGRGDGFTYPAEAPRARIDYLLASPDVRFRWARVVPTLASDHLPLVAGVSVSRR